ncbi:MAG: efflux RND transporter permease subunit [Calothrix sp. MO_167.B12]|nr:efflux RND transporter permease subunit [Calothrix sp. MO_167.B12]
MFTDFFIKRPVFTSVCAIIILLIGAISIPMLPTDRYPEISPTQINVVSNYVGANAEVVEKTVTNVIERQINGVEGLKYMTSSSNNDGTSTIRVTFDASRDKDIAAVDVQNRVSLAEPQLPESVQKTGVSVSKEVNNFLLGIGLYSENQEYDTLFLSNYADLYILDNLKKIEGVSTIRVFGERRYAMRLWLDPKKLANRNLTDQDVVNAINEQNLQVGAGQIGQQPAPEDQMYIKDIRVSGRLKDISEFENIVIKTGADGSLIRLKDVGRAELGAENYNNFFRFKDKDGIGLGIFQTPGSNALEVATAVKKAMAEMAKDLPPGMKYVAAFDATTFIKASLSEVVKTLFLAIFLVIIVVFIFLEDWRTTIIPVLTIPLALIGTFIFVKAFSFSINTLTLFGLTLATGMVVDDAIVVVEDISRLIQEKGMSPPEAASKAMRTLSGAIIATSLVLMAVFIPVAFFPGSAGKIYRQFALTIAFSITISTFLALTLTPALSALLLRKTPKRRGVIGWIFGRVNWFFDGLHQNYRRVLNQIVRFKFVVLAIFVTLLAVTGWLYTNVPTAFIPDEDQGYFMIVIQGKEGVSLNYTNKVMHQVEEEVLKLPEVNATFAVGGFSFSGATANTGVIWTTLKPWDERAGKGQSAQEIMGQLMPKFFGITDARVIPVNPPAIPGLGSFSGFQFQLQDHRGNTGLNNMLQIMGQLIGQSTEQPELQGVFSIYMANMPQLEIEVDRNRAKALQVSISDIFNTLQSYLGSRYVNDFNLGQRTYRVYVQADAKHRSNPEDIGELYVRSATNRMIPLSNLVKVTQTTGAQTINHYNLHRSIEINGSAAPGFSSGQAMNAMEGLANKILPASMGFEWSGISAEEQESGGQAPLIFGLGLVLVFLVLSAQYENYVDPLIIMLSVPLAILGALSAQSLRGLPNDIFCQVGLVMLIGLASKNAILIVEFANQLREEQGVSIVKAALQASQERLRPILMTAFSTLLGIFPLMIATGAGAPSRQSLGTAVFGGMFVATFLSLFIVPVLYIIIVSLRENLKPPHQKPPRKIVENGKVSSIDTLSV